MQPPFPFSAIVGQEALKRALILGVIQPNLGGVLVRGTKGVAKSTAVRALAGLLPAIETVAGCPLQRRPGEEVAAWPLPPDAPTVTRPVPLVELPLGATEDRVLGALHLERALRGQRAFEPGLLAAANRGILYIDEVNLLPDHLVDVLLDAAAGGTHRLEREGLSVSHPARFLLVGTMNPEEGELRPQLLDRFGLAADVGDLADPDSRAEAVRRRLACEADPAGFAAAWSEADGREAERIAAAQRLLPRVRVPEGVLHAVTRRCLAAGVAGLRADLALCRAACAWAAYQGRDEVGPDDVEAVAELALAHRRTRPPEPPGGGGRAENGEGRGQAGKNAGPEPGTNHGDGTPSPQRSSPYQTFESAGVFSPLVGPPAAGRGRAAEPGRDGPGAVPSPGRAAGAVRRYEPGCALSWATTLRAAASAQGYRGGRGEDGLLAVLPEDLRGRPRRGPAGRLLLFVVDASGSMAAWRRMRQTKAAVLSLLVEAYQRRDRVALLAFHGGGAELVLPPARGLGRARLALERLPVGGPTPLAEGLAAAGRLLRADKRRRPGQPAWVVLLTDGRANLASGSAAPWEEALRKARSLAGCGAHFLVVDTETGACRLGRATALARALGAPCLALEDVLGPPLADRWRHAV
jgi:magnesium chelatase subunit D